MAADDQLARTLGSGWEGMGYRQNAARAIALEQAAILARTLARYIVEAETDTTGEALAFLQASGG